MSGFVTVAISISGLNKGGTPSPTEPALQCLHSQSPLGRFLGSSGGSLQVGEEYNTFNSSLNTCMLHADASVKPGSQYDAM